MCIYTLLIASSSLIETFSERITVPYSYKITNVCDFSCGTTSFCNHGPHGVKAMVHDHKWFKSMRGLKPPKAMCGLKPLMSPVDTSGSSHI